VDTYPKLKFLKTYGFGGPRGAGSITMKNSCCHSIIAVPLRSAQRMITKISQLKTQTHTFSHQKASKTKKWSIFILIIKSIVDQ
jgi:hypothetical protein